MYSPPPCGNSSGFMTLHTVHGICAEYGQREAFGEERDLITKEKIDGNTNRGYKQLFEAI